MEIYFVCWINDRKEIVPVNHAHDARADTHSGTKENKQSKENENLAYGCVYRGRIAPENKGTRNQQCYSFVPSSVRPSTKEV